MERYPVSFNNIRDGDVFMKRQLKKITLSLPPDTEQMLRKQAKKRKLSLSRVAVQNITVEKALLLKENQQLRQKLFLLRQEIAREGGEIDGDSQKIGKREKEGS